MANKKQKIVTVAKPGKKSQPKFKYDLLLWIVSIVLVTIGIVGNSYFPDLAWALKAVIWIGIAAVVITLFALTSQGKRFWHFAKESRIEMRKIVWPKRQETVRTTAIVIVVVLITALILWGADSILLWLIGLLTGQRG